jgi:hypothetical protein
MLPTPVGHFSNHRYRGNDSMNKQNFNLTQMQLHELLAYDPATGLFAWKISKNGRVKVGDRAGSKNNLDYMSIMIQKKSFKAHRLAWLYFYGCWPKNDLDHINGLRSDNRIANLREVTKKQNNENTTTRKDNASGYRGVSIHKQTGKWMARVSHHGVRIHAGLFDSKEDANFAAIQKRSELYTHSREGVCK